MMLPQKPNHRMGICCSSAQKLISSLCYVSAKPYCIIPHTYM